MSGRTIVLALDGGRRGNAEIYRRDDGTYDFRLDALSSDRKRVRASGTLPLGAVGRLVNDGRCDIDGGGGWGWVMLSTAPGGALLSCMVIRPGDVTAASALPVTLADLDDLRVYAMRS